MIVCIKFYDSCRRLAVFCPPLHQSLVWMTNILGKKKGKRLSNGYEILCNFYCRDIKKYFFCADRIPFCVPLNYDNCVQIFNYSISYFRYLLSRNDLIDSFKLKKEQNPTYT